MRSLSQQISSFPTLHSSIRLGIRGGSFLLAPAGKTSATLGLVASGVRNQAELPRSLGTIDHSSFWSRLRFRPFKARREPPVAAETIGESPIAVKSGVSVEQQQDQGKMSAQSTYYISHGSPMLPLEDNAAKHFYLDFAKSLPDRPKAILMISAHWDTREPMVSTTVRNGTIYDFYGFPPELYKLSYNPPGAPAVGRRTMQLLQEAGFHVSEDKKRGLDHGAWVPLFLMYPQADIPVFQLSVQSHRNAAYHYKIGQALQPLKDEGVMIVGSGSATHNLREFMMAYSSRTPPSATQSPSWARLFDDFVREALLNGRFEDVMQYESRAPNAKRAHPSNEHFVPLLVALGASSENAKAELIHTSWEHDIISYSSYAFRRQ